MKKVFFGLMVSFSALSVSCDYHDPNEDKFNSDPSAGYVEFGMSRGFNTANTAAGSRDDFSVAGTAFDATVGCESSNEIRIPVVLEAPVNEGLTVNYTISDVVGTSAGVINAAPLTFAEGALATELVINYPSELTTNLEFTVTLDSTSNGSVTIGGPENETPQVVTVRINAQGNEVLQGYYSGTRGGDAYLTSVSHGDEPNEYIIRNLTGIDPESETRIFLNENGTVSFPPYQENFLTTSPDPAVGDIYIDGVSGTYTLGCDNTIIIRYRQRQGPNASPVGNVLTATLTRI